MADAITMAILSPNSRQNRNLRGKRAEDRSFIEWRDAMGADGWRTPNTYGRDYGQITNIPAVYLFNIMDMDGWAHMVAYVGMSTNLQQRITGHPILSEITVPGRYVQTWFKPTPRDQLRQVERSYIQQFNPPWNIVGKKRGLDL